MALELRYPRSKWWYGRVAIGEQRRGSGTGGTAAHDKHIAIVNHTGLLPTSRLR